MPRVSPFRPFPAPVAVPFFEAIRLAFAQIRVQKLKSFFTLLGVMIGVMFLIAVVSIVGGMGNYMKDELMGKLIAINSFELRQRPNINIGDVNDAERRSWRTRPRIYDIDVPPVVAALAPGTALGRVQLQRHHRRGAVRLAALP